MGAIVAAVGVAAVWVAGSSVLASAPREGTRAQSAIAPGTLPPVARPAFVPRRPQLLRRGEHTTDSAPVLQRLVARSGPRTRARALATLEPRTPEGTTNLVVIDDVVERGGLLWARVELPVLPNGTEGWVPRSGLGGYTFLDTRLVVDRSRLEATLYRGREAVFRAPVGIGTPSSPTPAGTFYVREMLRGFGDPFYGPIAFGTNARSATLTDWPGGGFIGIHGTNEPQLIPGRISHGCIRMRNAAILRLAHLLPVGSRVIVL
jgi:L,D-transpeptidase-like protein